MVTVTPFDEGSRIGYDGFASHLDFLPGEVWRSSFLSDTRANATRSGAKR